jgi:hypothetical protein
MLSSRYIDNITSGLVEITADQFPNFLYDEEEADALLEDDPEDWDPERGLLRSFICLWVSFWLSSLNYDILSFSLHSLLSVYLWEMASGLQTALGGNRPLAKLMD